MIRRDGPVPNAAWALLRQLTEAQKTALHAVAMDMWEAYIGATRAGLPDGDAKIVFDRLHIMREMTKAVDTVRKQEHRAPDHQRSGRRPQQHNHEYQTQGWRLPQPRELHDRDLLSLRRPGFIPTLIPEGSIVLSRGLFGGS